MHAEQGFRLYAKIFKFLGVALKLETLVGDLEDAVLSALNRRTGYIFSRIDPSPSIPGVMTNFALLSLLSCTCMYMDDEYYFLHK